ncbi:MAG: DUF5659 domain-containing protein [Syntrophothermus sp.]
MNNENIQNRDFYLSAFLVSQGCNIVSLSREKGITTFIFANDEKVTKLTEDYFSMKALVEPLSYGNALRNLKSIIHATDTNANKYVKQSRTTNS